MIKIKPVDKNNWKDCIKLSLLPEQEGNLAPNVYTIAESKFEPHYHVRAIYKDSEIIGMLSYCYEDAPLNSARIFHRNAIFSMYHIDIK